MNRYLNKNPKRRADDDIEDDEGSYPDSGIQMYSKQQIIQSVDVYLDQNIGPLAYYRNLIYYMHNMQEQDELRIWIDNYGGSLDTALAIIDAMRGAQGKITCIVSGNAASAASLIALSADNLVVGDHSRFMCHAATYSTGASKQGDIETLVQYSAKMLRNFTQKAYEGFMTQAELEQMWMGKDFWMDSDEVVLRLKDRERYWELKDNPEKAPEVKAKKPRKAKSTIKASPASEPEVLLYGGKLGSGMVQPADNP